MQEFTINSRHAGPVVFSCPANGGYVFAHIGGHGTRQHGQICKGGRVSGPTLTAGLPGGPTLETVARRWWRQYRARYRDTD